MKPVTSIICILIVILAAGTVHAASINTTFTYQGEISSNDLVVNGNYDFEFQLWDALEDGSTVSSVVSADAVTVVNGVFTTELDFGSAPFNGSNLWLMIQVRVSSSGSPYTELLPRQPLTAAPYALHAETVPENSITSIQIDSASVQSRVSGSCPSGQAISQVNLDGTVSCVIGPAGADGVQGPAGAAGAQGLAGADGVQGLAGAAGAQGLAGSDGVQGPAGAAGAQGPAGAAGAQGLAGADGVQGLAGAAGAQGLAGADGVQGPAGADGVQGPAGDPQTSVDGLTGGTLTGNTAIDGDLTVTGNLITNGSISNYPTNPVMVVGHTTPGCRQDATQNFSTIQFPFNFESLPFFHWTIDETLNNNGAILSHLQHWYRNSVTVTCNNASDGGFWMSADMGSFTISGKKVVIGRQTNLLVNTLISFGETFASPPVVLLYPDFSDGNYHAADTWVRIVETVTTDGFQIQSAADLPALHWIAMEAGEYQHGRYHWSAGIGAGAISGAAFEFTSITPGVQFESRPRVLLTIHDTNASGGTTSRVRELNSDGFQLYINSSSEFINFIAIEDTY